MMSGGIRSPTGDGDAPAYRENPMHNQVVLSHFFTLLPSDLLASCRLVSKEWNNLALTSWRSTATLKLRFLYRPFDLPAEDPDPAEEDNMEVEQEVDPEGFGPNQPIREYLDFVDDTTVSRYHLAPHRQLTLQSWNFLANWKPRFWNSVAIHVTTLRLEFCGFFGARDFRRITYQSCPNLRNLCFSQCYFNNMDPEDKVEGGEYMEPVFGEHRNLKELAMTWEGGHDDRRLPVSWLELLSHFPALTSFELLVLYREGAVQTPDTWNILQAITKVRRHDDHKLPLRKLKINADQPMISNAPESFAAFTLLRLLAIPLKSLKISVDPEVDTMIIKGILEPHMETLTKIDMRGSGPPLPFGLDSQLFKNITELNVSGSLLENLDFLKFMGNLNYLFITDDGFDRDVRRYNDTRMIARTSKGELANVKLNVSFLSFQYRVNGEDLKFLIKLLPNVTILEMVLNNELFPIICEHWIKLRSITAYGDDLTEEGITGRALSETDKGVDGDGGNEKEARPNIASLQELVVVRFLDVNVTRGILTHGLLKLPQLGSFWALHGTQLQDEERNELKAKNIWMPC